METLSITERVILFSRFLKDHGFRIFPSGTVDALRGLEMIDLAKRADFFSVLRAGLVTNDLEWRQFEDLFDEFWQDARKMEAREEADPSREEAEFKGEAFERLLEEVTPHSESVEETPSEGEREDQVAYSPLSRLEKKDLGRFEQKDIRIARLILKDIVSPFRISKIRRLRKSKRPGDLDFGRILRKSLKGGGVPLTLYYRKKRKKLKRLVILSDVSGSMDRYARFVMPFILGVRGVASKAEVFVFSTSLTPVTTMVKRFSIDKALEKIAREVPDWAGGTKIGYSLHQFNQGHWGQLLNKRSVVIILSDGWDLGGKELLRREMEIINRKADCIIWLNPLAGEPDYRPVCRGMQTALPYVHYFLPANNLQSLRRVGRILARVVVRH